MEQTADEITRLQGCINDLIGILALPAMWSGQESSQIVSTLLDGLVGMLRLDFAYAQLSEDIDDSPIELVRMAPHRHPAAPPQEVSRALSSWLMGAPRTSPCMVPNPVGAGEVTITSLRLGLQEDVGILVAGSQRADFPTQHEVLLLRVAVNQAAMALQEARRLSEQRRAAEMLEHQVAERTRQLTAVNEELRQEITERKHAEAEREKLALLVENSTDFIGITALEGQVLFVNPAGQKMVGLSGDESIQATRVLDYVVEQDREQFQQHVLPVVLREGRWEGETQFRHFRTGAPIHQCCNISSVSRS